jgi:L-ornithine Nalpha-acyltransferase
MSSPSAATAAALGPPLRLGGLEMRLAAPDEMAGVMALRARAFRGDARADDSDAFDAGALHLRVGPPGGAARAALRLIVHPEGEIAGYAAAHYDLRALAAAPGRALELGRLCLDPDHPDPDLMRLIWAGVARAVDGLGAARLIGCTSFRGTDPVPLAPALGLLAQRHIGPDGLRPPMPQGARAALRCDLAQFAPAAGPEGAALLPPLLRAYLALGGWVSDHVVIDPDLGTCHVFTCVEVAGMPEGRKRVLRGLAGQA